MTEKSIAADERSSDGWRGTLLLAAAFWSCAFLINEGMASLRGELPFAAAGGHRASAFAFGALLALATANLLRQIGPDTRKQAMLAASTVVLMPVLHAIFFYFTCKVAPIAGVAPMTVPEAVQKALLSTGYFAAWIALQLAVIYHREARRAAFPHGPAQPNSAPAAADESGYCWASWRNQRVCVRLADIRWVEAQKDYAILHCADRSCILRSTLGSLVAELGPEFVRVHRSVIVRRSMIGSVYRKPTGALALSTTCGAELPVGRSYSTALRDRSGHRQHKLAGRSSQI